ncbi:MAG: UDP-glucose/GDP-mannose dehydrogenase family protein [Actinomycetaceae bacterium]|nr:UDP-glucose/GDP-mannose dehydrogenase family protein [Actinomycetaceae bacterium]
MKISVIGCGYLGAVHAACMSSIGHTVIGIDTDPLKIAALSTGNAPFHEPGFDDLLRAELESGRLSFAVWEDVESLRDVDVHFLAVGTPQVADGTRADLTYLNSAVEEICARGIESSLVVGKSTVPVGTAARLADTIRSHGGELMWNPEFLRESHAVADTLHPDRLVYGLPEEGLRAAFATAVLDEVYAPLIAEGIPRLTTNLATAELVKTAANAFLATKISFINAMAEVCEAAGGDVTVLADAIGYDKRIGRRFLGAGIGFGGGCLPKDIRAFRTRAEELGCESSLSFLRNVDDINERRRQRAIDLAQEILGSLEGAHITVLGAAFKPNSDDVRDSPALDVAKRLADAGATVTVTDPKALHNAARVNADLHLCRNTSEALKNADLVVLATEWPEYLELDPAGCAALVASPRMLDARNALDRDTWLEAGWDVHCLGRSLPTEREHPWLKRTETPAEGVTIAV